MHHQNSLYTIAFLVPLVATLLVFLLGTFASAYPMPRQEQQAYNATRFIRGRTYNIEFVNPNTPSDTFRITNEDGYHAVGQVAQPAVFRVIKDGNGAVEEEYMKKLGIFIESEHTEDGVVIVMKDVRSAFKDQPTSPNDTTPIGELFTILELLDDKEFNTRNRSSTILIEFSHLTIDYLRGVFHNPGSQGIMYHGCELDSIFVNKALTAAKASPGWRAQDVEDTTKWQVQQGDGFEQKKTDYMFKELEEKWSPYKILEKLKQVKPDWLEYVKPQWQPAQ